MYENLFYNQTGCINLAPYYTHIIIINSYSVMHVTANILSMSVSAVYVHVLLCIVVYIF